MENNEDNNNRKTNQPRIPRLPWPESPNLSVLSPMAVPLAPFTYQVWRSPLSRNRGAYGDSSSGTRPLVRLSPVNTLVPPLSTAGDGNDYQNPSPQSFLEDNPSPHFLLHNNPSFPFPFGPSSQFSGGQNPSAWFSAFQNPPPWFSGEQYPSHPFSSGQNTTPQFSGDQNPSSQFSSNQNPSSLISGNLNPTPQFSGDQNPSSQFSSNQNPSSLISGDQNPTPQFSSDQNPSSHFSGDQNPTSQFSDNQNPNPQFSDDQNSSQFSDESNPTPRGEGTLTSALADVPLKFAAGPGDTDRLGADLDPNMDPKRRKRLIANRVSAQKSRQRRIQYIFSMEKKAKDYENQIAVLSPQVAMQRQQEQRLRMENRRLNEAVHVRASESLLKDAEIEQRQAEVIALREYISVQERRQEERALMLAWRNGFMAQPMNPNFINPNQPAPQLTLPVNPNQGLATNFPENPAERNGLNQQQQQTMRGNQVLMPGSQQPELNRLNQLAMNQQHQQTMIRNQSLMPGQQQFGINGLNENVQQQQQGMMKEQVSMPGLQQLGQNALNQLTGNQEQLQTMLRDQALIPSLQQLRLNESNQLPMSQLQPQADMTRDPGMMPSLQQPVVNELNQLNRNPEQQQTMIGDQAPMSGLEQLGLGQQILDPSFNDNQAGLEDLEHMGALELSDQFWAPDESSNFGGIEQILQSTTLNPNPPNNSE